MKEIKAIFTRGILMISLLACLFLTGCGREQTPGGDAGEATREASAGEQETTASGEDNRSQASSGLAYTLFESEDDSDSSYYVSGIGSCTDKDLVIPSTYEGKRVGGIGEKAFEQCTQLTGVTIPDGVTWIGESAFQDCANLKTVHIPDSVTYIANHAFQSCSALSGIVIPEGVTTIGQSAFCYCAKLNSITLPKSLTYVGSGAFWGTEYYNRWLPRVNVLYIDNILIQGVSNLSGTVTVQDGTTCIASGAFSDCTGIKSVTIPNSVTHIGSFAFSRCTGITSITIPNSVSYIGEMAFMGCSNLKTIKIGKGVSSLGSLAFFGCDKLEGVYITDLASWCNISFNSNGSNPLYWAHKLYLNKKLVTSLVIPDGVTSIPGVAFYGCESLMDVIIPDGVTSIDDDAFMNCSNLMSVTIPASVASIGETAFSGCPYLMDIFFEGTADQWRSIEKGDNWGPAVCTYTITCTDENIVKDHEFGEWTITVKATCITTGREERSCACGAVEQRQIDALGHSFEDDVCIQCKRTTNHNLEFSLNDNATGYIVTGIGDCKSADIFIPAEHDGKPVVGIKENAFKDCTSITNMTIPDSVTSIGSSAFSGCSGLKSITIPDSVTIIGANAFNDTAYYRNASNWTDDMLYLGSVLLECKRSKTGAATIKDGTTYIACSAFQNCSNLKSITIPDSVTGIGKDAFLGCTGLTSVHITDITGWCGISFANEGANPLSYSNILYVNGELLTTLRLPDRVTSIGDWAFNTCSGLTSIVIGSGLTGIGDSAFSGCSGLSSIIIPDSVTSIGKYAFSGTAYYNDMSNWTDGMLYIGSMLIACKTDKTGAVTIKDGTTCIAGSAFSGCSGLTRITIPDSVVGIGEQAFCYCSGLSSVTIGDGVISIGYKAFYECTGLDSINIPDSVTDIGNYVFYKCSGLTSVTIGSGVTGIGYRAFYGCTGLESITIPDSVTNISSSAFEGCSGLTSITVGKGVTGVGKSAFFGCEQLTDVYITDIGSWCNILFASSEANPLSYPLNHVHNLYLNGELVTSPVIPNDVTGIGDYAFYGYGNFASITIPDSVTRIGVGAFKYCPGLTSVTIGNGVTGIGEGAFSGCGDLTNVTIGNGVTGIGNEMFSGCIALTNITIPDSVTSIGNSAFNNCYRLSSITIPDSVTGIGDYAFRGCSGLTRATIGSSVTSIGHHAFCNCTALKSITMRSNMTSIGADAFGGTAYYNDNSNWTSDVLYVGSTVIACKTHKTGAVVIKEGTTHIADSAFSGCNKIKSIVIPDSIISIGANAFYNCQALTSVHITDIAAWCNISFASTQANPFFYAHNLYINGELVTSLVIPDDVTGIGNHAFTYCTGLTSVTIPASVTAIGEGAFSNCKNLESITFTGTQAQWEAIEKGNNWIHDKWYIIIHCTDGDVA